MSRNNSSSKTFSSKHCHFLICMCLVTATLAVYWQVKNYDFILLDDNFYFTDNRHVQNGFNLEGIQWSFTNTDFGMWIPMVWLSYMAGNQLYGKSPGWHHLTNVFLHLLNVLFLFLLLTKLTDTFWQSALVAALFALHPLHVESVAWITERKDVLSTLFLLLTIWEYSRYVKRPRIGSYILTIIFFALGLMSKPMLVTLPFLLILLDFWPLGRFRFEQPACPGGFENRSRSVHILIEKIPFFMLSTLAGVVTFLAHQKLGIIPSINEMSIADRITNALVSYANYIKKMIWPSKLAVLYPLPETFLWWEIAGAFVLLTAISLLAIRNMRQRPYLMVGWMWYLGALVPVIGLLQAGSQAMADRFVYVPFIGLYIMIVWGFSELMARRPYKKIWLIALCAIFFPILMGVSWKQVRYWKNSNTLFEHTLEVTSNNGLAHANLGVALFGQGKIDDAIHHYRKALEINSAYVYTLSNLGLALAHKGQVDEAERYYNKALQINPEHTDAHYNLGILLLKQNRLHEAYVHFAETIRIDPDFAEAYDYIGLILAHHGKLKKAEVFFSRAIHIAPNFLKAQKHFEDNRKKLSSKRMLNGQ